MWKALATIWAAALAGLIYGFIHYGKLNTEYYNRYFTDDPHLGGTAESFSVAVLALLAAGLVFVIARGAIFIRRHILK